MNITNNIPKLLKENNVSIKKLGEEIGMDYSPTFRLVKRDNLLSTTLETLLKVSNVLNVDIEELYREVDQKC